MPPPYEILSDDEECDDIYCECDECYTSDTTSDDESCCETYCKYGHESSV